MDGEGPGGKSTRRSSLFFCHGIVIFEAPPEHAGPHITALITQEQMFIRRRHYYYLLPALFHCAVALCCGTARSSYARVFWDSVGVFAAFCGLPKLKRAPIGFALAALVSVSKHSGRLLEIQLGKLLAPALSQCEMTDKISREHTGHFSTAQPQP